MENLKMQYRPEIDGLRAIAVLPVIVFHAGISAFSGGFVGVDVFFVISGYLITSIIISEKQAGTFTLVNFYERRARRILPALFVVMAACLPFAWMWMFPEEMKDFSRSLMGVSAFVSNILFWRESGYFVTAAELKPLLHTWSLSVEEQYYLLFPLFLIYTYRLGRRWVVGTLLVVFLISLAGAQWGSAHKTIANFYSLPTRAWELLIGSFIALVPNSSHACAKNAGPNRLSLNQYGSLIGLLLISFSIFYFNRDTPHPSIYTLIPTVGAGCVIMFATPVTLVGRLLSSRILVFVGSISYATYLWHQPLFAFARYRTINEPSTLVFLGLTLTAMVLATLSLRFLELPFRNLKFISRKGIFGVALTGTLCFFILGALWYSKSGLPDRLPANLSTKFFPEKTNESTACNLAPVESAKTLHYCYFGDINASRTVALYGDSHAQTLFSELDSAFKTHAIRGLRVYMTNCEPIPQILVANNSDISNYLQQKECLITYSSLLDYLKQNASAIIIGLRWTMRMYPIKGSVDELAFNNGEGGREHIEPRKYTTLDLNGIPSLAGAGKKDAIDMLLRTMNELNKPVFVIHPIPEVGWDIPKYNFVSYLNDKSTPVSISTSHERFKNRNSFINDVLNNAQNYQNLIHIKPERHLCDSLMKGRCVAQWNDTPLYYDDDHLSNAGARMIIQDIISNLVK
uniref:acyltransferase family protein n=1 Tax=Limnohabitans sp. TaxID=1907725 RepID=UPI0040489370